MQSLIEKAAFRGECEQVLFGLYYALEGHRNEEVAGFFAEDGEWTRMGKVYRGRQAIIEAIATRPATFVARHVLTNLLVMQQDETSLDAVAYMLPFAGDAGAEHKRPVQVSQPLGVFLVKARFVRASAGVKMSRLDMTQDFAFAQT